MHCPGFVLFILVQSCVFWFIDCWFFRWVTFMRSVQSHFTYVKVCFFEPSHCDCIRVISFRISYVKSVSLESCKNDVLTYLSFIYHGYSHLDFFPILQTVLFYSSSRLKRGFFVVILTCFKCQVTVFNDRTPQIRISVLSDPLVIRYVCILISDLCTYPNPCRRLAVGLSW